MRKKRLSIAVAFISALVSMALAGCSSDDPTDLPNSVEFKTTAADLNGHLANVESRFMEGIPYCAFSITSKECPEIEYVSLNMSDVYDIPAKGGTYDFKTDPGVRLEILNVYEDVPRMSHNRDDYENHQGECLAYWEEICKREGADASIGFAEMTDSGSGRFGVLSNADPSEELRAFTYTFPENHTGKCRLIEICYKYEAMDMTNLPYMTVHESSSYFIQLPD